ncbi:MAG: hypothetical protein KC912_00810 [Proteobacteria bacterium]|nr:hypothetical protein [Pseudomonadota bacterium]
MSLRAAGLSLLLALAPAAWAQDGPEPKVPFSATITSASPQLARHFAAEPASLGTPADARRRYRKGNITSVVGAGTAVVGFGTLVGSGFAAAIVAINQGDQVPVIASAAVGGGLILLGGTVGAGGTILSSRALREYGGSSIAGAIGTASFLLATALYVEAWISQNNVETEAVIIAFALPTGIVASAIQVVGNLRTHRKSGVRRASLGLAPMRGGGAALALTGTL